MKLKFMTNEKDQNYVWKPSPASGKFNYLFVFLLAELAVYPWERYDSKFAIWFRLLNILVTVSSVYAVSFRRLTWIVAAVIAAPVAFHRALLFEITASKLDLAGAFVGIAFDIFIIVVIFRRAFQIREVTSDAIYGAVSIYLLIGFSFMRIYTLLVTFQPDAFYLDPRLYHHSLPVQSDMFYYSFVTMTSLGAVGIAPASDQARAISVVESVIGILYLGVLVSRLIAAYRSPYNRDTQS
jgi:Ion channel